MWYINIHGNLAFKLTTYVSISPSFCSSQTILYSTPALKPKIVRQNKQTNNNNNKNTLLIVATRYARSRIHTCV